MPGQEVLMADFELLDDDYFPALADALAKLVQEGEIPVRFHFREEEVELPSGGLIKATLESADAMGMDARGRDWRPTVFQSLGLNMVSDVEITSEEGLVILEAIAAGTASLGDIVMLSSHANTEICGEFWETPAERLELARMKGLFATSHLALRQVLGQRLVTETRLPEIGDTIASVFNPDMMGTLEAVIAADDELHHATELIARNDDGGTVQLVAGEGAFILQSRKFSRLDPIIPEASPPTFH
jgi:hypothetical protein